VNISGRFLNFFLHPVLRTALLGVLCLAFYLPGQMSLPPIDRDEARFAQASKQMVETGDYTDIRFQEVPRHKKPIGIYWLQTLSVKAAGVVDAIWPYRAVSWMAAMFAVVLSASLAARLFGPVPGLLAGVMLASCLLLNVEARMAKTDAMLLFTIIAAQCLLARAYLDQQLSKFEAGLFWLAMGVGTLVKGPIILLAIGGTVVWLGLRDRSATWLTALYPKQGVVLYLLVVLPWLVAITIRSNGAFWSESVGQDLLAKAAGVQESHGGKPGYYLLTFFFTFWPWAFLLLPLVPFAWKQRKRPEVAYCLAAIIPFWLVFELFPTKLMHYTLPTFPFIAMLMAAMLCEGALPARASLRSALLALGALLVAVLALLLPFVPVGIGASASADGSLLAALTNSPPSIASLLAAMGLVSLLVVAWRLLKNSHPARALLCFVVGLWLVYAASFGLLLPHLDAMWPSRAAANLIRPQIAACNGPLLSVGYAEPSLVFQTSTNLRLREADAALSELVQPSCALVLVDGQNKEKMEAGFTSLARQAIVLGTVTGFNYAKGDPVTLTLYRTQPEPTP